MERFDTFSAQAFEHLIQALAAHVFGPGIVIFGRGRDGGREATYDGQLPGFSGRNWNGYTVVQAKCREQPTHDAGDGNWLAGQLKRELDKFVENAELKAPQYYLLCANVELSAVPEVGGKAKVDAIFEQYKDKLLLRDWHVWSPDELRALLSSAPGIRSSYAAWVTPSDVLNSLLEMHAGKDVKRRLPLALAEELRSEESARLRDAGQETAHPIPLDKVFVDLPIDRPNEAASLIDGEQTPDASQDRFGEVLSSSRPAKAVEMCVSTILQKSGDKLDPLSLRSNMRKGRPLSNRIVVLGGPGQGKSTLGQLLAQVLRARLLDTVDELLLSPETSDTIKRIKINAERLSLPRVGPVRIPFRVDLPSFADSLHAGGEKLISILSFIADRLSKAIREEITTSSLKTLVQEFPCIFIFDGLDEVPQSANRQGILSEISVLLDEIHHFGADTLFVVTTRPQGYNNDLDPQYWQHWNLLPLTPNIAIDFARKLADIRLGSDENRRRAIIADVEHACEDPATKLLTTTPLQVAILFGISFLKGSIPADRWELFDKYYNLLRDREAQKPGFTAEFLRDNKRLVDAIHHDCGWLLQVDAERRGRTLSSLTAEQFREIVSNLLSDEGYETDEIDRMCGIFKRLTTDRLVLLSERVEGRIAFDVRSLQEYMAAAKLAGADHALIDARLRAVAARAHWRHVFRIAASKVFSVVELALVRTMIIAICDALDSGDFGDDASTIRAGSALALELLVDGVAASAPAFQRKLASRALGLLEAGLEAYDPRLTALSDLGFDELIRKKFSLLVGPQFENRSLGAWRLLTELASSVDWALKLMRESLPTDAASLLRVYESCSEPRWSAEFQFKVLSAQKVCGPRAAARLVPRLKYNEAKQGVVKESSFLLLGGLLRTDEHREIRIDIRPGISVSLTALAASADFAAAIPTDLSSPAWAPLRAIRVFAQGPSAHSLANAIAEYDGLDAVEADNSTEVSYAMPWPLESVLADLREGNSWAVLADMARRKEFGDIGDWRDAESRWQGTACSTDDLLTWNSGFYLSPEIGRRGLPMPSGIGAGVDADNDRYLDFLLDVIPQISPPSKQATLLRMIAVAARNVPASAAFKILDVYFRSAGAQLADPRLPFWIGPAVWEDPRVVDLADQIGRKGTYLSTHGEYGPLVSAFNRNTSKRGLLTLICFVLRRGARRGPEDLRRLHNSALEFNPEDEPAVRAAVAVLRVVSDKWDELDVPQLVEDIIGARSAILVNTATFAVQESRASSGLGGKHRALVYGLAMDEWRRTGYVGPVVFDALSTQVAGEMSNLASPLIARSLKLPCLTSAQAD